MLAMAPFARASSRYEWPSKRSPRRATKTDWRERVRLSVSTSATKTCGRGPGATHWPPASSTIVFSSRGSMLVLPSQSSGQKLPCHLPVVEVDSMVLELLVRFMPFASDKNRIVGSRHADAQVNGIPSIHFKRGFIGALEAGHDVLQDLPGVLTPRVVGGHHDVVG